MLSIVHSVRPVGVSASKRPAATSMHALQPLVCTTALVNTQVQACRVLPQRGQAGIFRTSKTLRLHRGRTVKTQAMVNVELSPATYLGVVLIGGGIMLMQIRSSKPVLSRDTDIIAACISILAGSILIFQGWRLDPILLFEQLLIASTALAFGVETLRLRAKVTEQLEEEQLQEAVEQDMRQRSLPPPMEPSAPWMQQMQQQAPWQTQQQQGYPAQSYEYVGTAADRYAQPSTSGRTSEPYYDSNSGQWYGGPQPGPSQGPSQGPQQGYYAGNGVQQQQGVPQQQQAWQNGFSESDVNGVRPNSPNGQQNGYLPGPAQTAQQQQYSGYSQQQGVQESGYGSDGGYTAGNSGYAAPNSGFVQQQGEYGVRPGSPTGQGAPGRAPRGAPRSARGQGEQFSVVDDWD